jgi:hypothetical protein
VELESVYSFLHGEVPGCVVAIIHRVNGFAGSGQSHLVSGKDELSQRWVLRGAEGRGEKGTKRMKGEGQVGEYKGERHEEKSASHDDTLDINRGSR